jgi:predicted dehydrogenase
VIARERRPLGVAMIGCGTIARYQHLPNLARLRGAQLVAVADADAGARRWAEARFRVRTCAGADEILAWPAVDAVVIAAPTAHHAEIATLAVAAGKPFYLEKPIAAGAGEAIRLLEAAAHANVPAAIGFHLRFQPLYTWAKQLQRRDALGELLAVRTLFAEPLDAASAAGWRSRRELGGGVLLDLGSHHVDLACWLLGDEIARVESASAEPPIGAPERVVARFVTRGGVGIESHFLYGAGPLDRLELVGRRATVAIDRHAGTLVVSGARRGRYGARRLRLTPPRDVVAMRLRRLLQPSWEPAFARALGAFVDAVRGRGGASSLASLADGAASLAVVLAAERAARDRCAVDVEPLGG